MDRANGRPKSWMFFLAVSPGDHELVLWTDFEDTSNGSLAYVPGKHIWECPNSLNLGEREEKHKSLEDMQGGLWGWWRHRFWIKVSSFRTQWRVSNNERIHGDQSTHCSRISHITQPCHLIVGRIVSLRWQKPLPLSAPWDPHLWHSHPYLNNLNGSNKKCPGSPHLANLEDALLLLWFFER